MVKCVCVCGFFPGLVERREKIYIQIIIVILDPFLLHRVSPSSTHTHIYSSPPTIDHKDLMPVCGHIIFFCLRLCTYTYYVCMYIRRAHRFYAK